MGEETEKYSAPALDKGLDILELLSLATEPLSMGQVAERLSRSKSEIFRMLVALERRGYILRNADSDRFEIGSRLFELAMHVTPTRNLVGTAMRHLEKVAHQLDQSCHLAVLSDTQIVVIARVEAPGEMGFSVRLGYRRRIDHSTSGHVLAAYASPGTLDVIIGRLTAEYPDFRARAFRAALARTRAEGHQREPSRSVDGITDIGAPVFGDTGFAVAALTVPFILRASSPIGLDQAAAVVSREAKLMSSELAVGVPTPVLATASVNRRRG